MRRVTVRSADAWSACAIRPAQDVELLLREPTGRRVKRRYTIRHARPSVGELDLDVAAARRTGRARRWGASAAPGDEVEFQGPRGKLELRPAPWHLLVGDESALPAIAAICEALPPGEPAIAVVEVADAARRAAASAAEVRWRAPRGARPGGADLLTGRAGRLDAAGRHAARATCWARPARWSRCARSSRSAASRTTRSS